MVTNLVEIKLNNQSNNFALEPDVTAFEQLDVTISLGEADF